MVQQIDPRQIVAQGYDRIAERYAQWAYHEVSDEVRPRYAAVLLEALPVGAKVLELGCGGGGPTTRQLAARFALTGIDISAHARMSCTPRLYWATGEDMTRSPAVRRRARIGATVDRELLQAVDAWLRDHLGSDRSTVLDEALRLWYAREQERAMEEQFASPPDVDPREWEAWRALQRAAAVRHLQSLPS